MISYNTETVYSSIGLLFINKDNIVIYVSDIRDGYVYYILNNGYEYNIDIKNFIKELEHPDKDWNIYDLSIGELV